MPITIGGRRESDFTDPIGMLGDCQRRIEMFLNSRVRVAEQAQGEALKTEQRGALESALRYFREAAPKHTADEEQSLFPRPRQVESAAVQALLARMEFLETDHEIAVRMHGEVDHVGRLWLGQGTLPLEQASRLLDLLVPLRDLDQRHIGVEEHELFPMSAANLCASDRQAIGREMASRRGVKTSS